MKSSKKSWTAIGAAVVALMCLGSTHPALAQSAAGCFLAPAKLSDGDISTFLQSPDGLLQEFTSGGVLMGGRVRSLAGSSSTTLDSLIGLVSHADAAQRSAIGSGLARAAKACVPTKPDYALLIQQKVAASNSPELVTAFLSTTNDLPTASLGGTASASASGITGGGEVGVTGGTGGDTSAATANPVFSVGTTATFSRRVRETVGTSQFSQ